jgi:hypothetical protein
MPDREPPDKDSPPPNEVKPAETRSDIINSVRTVLGFLALVVLIAEGSLITLAGTGKLDGNYAFPAMLLLLFALAVLVVVMAARWPAVFGLSPPPTPPANNGLAARTKIETTVIEQRLVESPPIVGEETFALAQERLAARQARDWAESDRLREAIAASGFIIEDSAGTYKLVRKPAG